MGEVEVDVPGKLFVGGLEIDVDDKVLEKAFGKFGRIIDTIIIKDRLTGQSRGYGFVTFENPGDAEDAVKGLNKKPLHGKEIFCEQATRRMSGISPRKRGPPPGPRGGPPPKRGMVSRPGDGPRRRDVPMRGPPGRRDGPPRGPPPRDDSIRGPHRGGHRDGLSSRDMPSRGPPQREGYSRGPPLRDGPQRDGMMRRPSRDALDGGRPPISRDSFGMSRGGRGGRGRGPPMSGRRSSIGGYDDGLSRRDDRLFRDERIESRRDSYLTSDSRDLGRGGYDRDRDTLLDSRSFGLSRRAAPLSREYLSDHDFYKPRDRTTSRDLHLGRDSGRGLARDSGRDFLRDDPLYGRDSFNRDASRDYLTSRDTGRSLERRPPISRDYSPYNGDFGHDAPNRGHGSSRDDFSRGPPMRRSSPGRGPPTRSPRGLSSRGPPPSRGPPLSRGPPPSRGGPSFDSHGPPSRMTHRDDRGRGDMSRGRGRRPNFDGPPMKRPRSSFPSRGAISRR